MEALWQRICINKLLVTQPHLELRRYLQHGGVQPLRVEGLQPRAARLATPPAAAYTRQRRLWGMYCTRQTVTQQQQPSHGGASATEVLTAGRFEELRERATQGASDCLPAAAAPALMDSGC